MSSDKQYIKQTSDVRLVIVKKPRYYVQRNNTEKGRDVTESYERLNHTYVRYVNVNNSSMIIAQGDRFFDTLEELYQTALAKSKLK